MYAYIFNCIHVCLCMFIICACVCEQWDRWRVSTVNSDYSVCPSYPHAVIVPREVDDGKLVQSARFRQGGRFPVLSYCHHRNGMVSVGCFKSC